MQQPLNAWPDQDLHELLPCRKAAEKATMLGVAGQVEGATKASGQSVTVTPPWRMSWCAATAADDGMHGEPLRE